MCVKPYGVLNGKKLSKIIGGLTTQIDHFPSQVSLRWHEGHICGGTIITEIHILTSASCVSFENNIFAGNIKILSGTDDQFDSFISDHLTEVTHVICHPNYDEQLHWINDICILKLATSLIFDDKRRNVNIAMTYRRSGFYLSTGWGDSHDIVRNQDKRFLQVVESKVESQETCFNYFKNYNFGLISSQNCATVTNKNAIIEQGDGGAGLINQNHGVDKTEGIISLILENKKNTFVYTKVWMYAEWIQSVIENY
ncbi:hypothetical protein HCN44_006507 [Aphidius gifuensis]|uniref:Peptidase S1 domain-containing protein n=1 Tax=Aphidius gifuensis TaxID=684658 RepID=A0A834XXM2_APHGI|nr:hypothetical protein HCN44_006507 [Aphidius gifuensis]